MAALSGLRSAIRWILSLSKRLISVVPGFTLYSVAATLVSQFALLLAFVLPLKVILLLGSEVIPKYFPQQFQVFDRQSLILALSGLSVLLYLIHLVSERIIGICLAGGARKLLMRSRKIVLFDKQDDVATRGYQRYSRGLASLVFVLLFFPLLVWLNPSLGGIFAGYMVVLLIGALAVCASNETIRERWSRDLGDFPAITTGLGFLLCFAYMVAEFLWLSPPSVLVAVVCLLMLRQLFKHVVSLTKNFHDLVGQRMQLSALFFHGQMLHTANPRDKTGVWALAEPEMRDQWVRAALAEVVSLDPEELEVTWLQSGIADVLVFRVCATAEGERQVFLIKLFNANRGAWAKHEATLLTSQSGLPSLRFAGATLISNGIHCHVFSLNEAHQVESKALGSVAGQAKVQLMACQPSSALLSLFSRSKPYLWQRLDRGSLQRLRCLMDDGESLQNIDRLNEIFNDIRDKLSELPECVINPDIKRGTVLLDNSGRALVCHWSRWTLEPVGCGWPVDAKGMLKLQEAVAEAALRRPELASVGFGSIKLAALMHAFERLYLHQDYLGVIALLPLIFEAYDDSCDKTQKLI